MDQLDLHLFVPAREFRVGFGIGHGNPVGDHRAELLDEQLPAEARFELAGRHRRPGGVQHGLVLRFADELAVQLELRHRQDPLPDLVVGDRHAEALGLGDHGLLVDELLQHLLLEAELSEQLLADAGPVRLPVGRHLALVGRPELQDADAPAVHLRDLVAWQGSSGGVFRAQEVRNVQNDERHHHKAEAPLEPALVTPHTVEHRHGACISIQSKLLV